MSYSYQSGAKQRKKAQKEKQFSSNYAKHWSICNRIKPANSYQIVANGRPELMLVPGLNYSLNGPGNSIAIMRFEGAIIAAIHCQFTHLTTL